MNDTRKTDFLIIGGSAAGTTAAEVIRGLKPDSTITIVTDESHEQYSRVLLPHYIRHKVNRDQVFLKKPEWYGDKKIELLKGIKAQKLDPDKKTVTFASTQNYPRGEAKETTGEHLGGEQIQYGKLLISIGGYVIKLQTPGANLENILYMRTVEDADKIIDVAKKSKKAVIVGGGFIGLEFCSCFKLNGVSEVTVLVLEDYYWQGKLDEDSSEVLVNTLEKNGIKIITGEEVDHFESSISHSRLDRESDPRFREDDRKTVGAVVTKSGKTFDVDVVGIGIGIKSDLSWLEGSGIEINRAIVTNEYLETNLPDVYAAGDCAEFKDVIFDRQHIMGNWANATSQGSAVGKTMSGQRTVFETASSYSINFFDPPTGGSCTFVGVTDDKFADEVVSRGSVESGKMTRIYIKNYSNRGEPLKGQVRIVGAAVINNPAEVAPLTSAVKNKIDIAAHKEKFGNVDFDLKEMLAVS